jgi:hypothetical protein
MATAEEPVAVDPLTSVKLTVVGVAAMVSDSARVALRVIVAVFEVIWP